MLKIRIYTKSGNQIDLKVKRFTTKRSIANDEYTEWKAEWEPEIYPRIYTLLPSQIEAVVILEDDVSN